MEKPQNNIVCITPMDLYEIHLKVIESSAGQQADLMGQNLDERTQFDDGTKDK